MQSHGSPESPLQEGPEKTLVQDQGDLKAGELQAAVVVFFV